eukprot:CAMPEP_0179985174 /NCGR_PEP_ID=MMETSP0984-20121128/1542_1 /TAXON_ID=483367 /ORGANISM="non described non described, Strain CCMP 2436" /LENGTH=30 /DNA_ID= /DNA_START= /DNA_END= /DNA_ORIENTATION=
MSATPSHSSLTVCPPPSRPQVHHRTGLLGA